MPVTAMFCPGRHAGADDERTFGVRAEHVGDIRLERVGSVGVIGGITPTGEDSHGTLNPYGYACFPAVSHRSGIYCSTSSRCGAHVHHQVDLAVVGRGVSHDVFDASGDATPDHVGLVGRHLRVRLDGAGQALGS